MTKIKQQITDDRFVADCINQIGYENVLQIIPYHCYNGSMFLILYKDGENNEIKC